MGAVQLLHQNLLDATGEPFVNQGNRWLRLAIKEIGSGLPTIDPMEGAETIAALHLMRRQVPWMFASDRSFDFLLVRRWRSLGETAWGSTWDNRRGKARNVYKDLRPQVKGMMGLVLRTAYAPFAAYTLRALDAQASIVGDALASLTPDA